MPLISACLCLQGESYAAEGSNQGHKLAHLIITAQCAGRELLSKAGLGLFHGWQTALDLTDLPAEEPASKAATESEAAGQAAAEPEAAAQKAVEPEAAEQPAVKPEASDLSAAQEAAAEQEADAEGASEPEAAEQPAVADAGQDALALVSEASSEALGPQNSAQHSEGEFSLLVSLEFCCCMLDSGFCLAS